MTAPSSRALVVTLLAAASAYAAERATFLHTPPAEAKPGAPLTIEGTLAGSESFDRLAVMVRGPGEAWEEVGLELQYGDLYRAQLPAARLVPPALEYYVEGVRGGDRVALLASAARPVKVAVPGEPPAKVKAKEKDAEVAKEPPQAAALALEEVQDRLAKRCKRNKRTKECQELLAREQEARREQEAPERAEKEQQARQEADARAAAERAREVARPREPRAADGAGGKAKAEPPAEVPRTRSELEEELAVYAAEQPAGVVQRLEDASRRGVLRPTVLTALQLRQLGARTVHQALDTVLGMAVTRDVQGHWRVAVRGLRSDPEVLFLFNGQRLNNFYDGKVLDLPLDGLERLEISLGPATADLGPQAFLAVVNLVTDRSDGLRAGFSAGLYQTYDGHLTAAHRFGPLTVFADADVASQAGYRKPVPRDGLDTTGARSQFTSDRRLLVNAGGGLSFASAAAGKLTAQLRFLLEDRAPLIGRFDVVGNESRLGWQALQVSLGWERALGDATTLSARLWLDQQATDRLWQLSYDGYQARAGADDTVFPDGMREELKASTRSVGLAGAAEVRLPAHHHLRAGLHLELEALTAFDTLANYVPGTDVSLGSTLKRPDGLRYPTEDGRGGRGPAADRLAFGLSASDTWTPHEVITLQAGLRLDFTRLPTADAQGAWTGAALVPSLGPRLGLALSPIRSLVLRGSYGRSFRAPTVQELAEPVPDSDVNQGRFVGNPRLQGASIDAADAGGEYVQAVGEARLRLKGQLFFERVSNAISMVDTSGNLVPYRNRPLGVQAWGAEGEARLELSRRATAWINCSWVRPEDLGTPAQSRLLTEASQIRLNAGFTLPVGPYVNLDVLTRFASERRNDSRSVLELVRRYTLPGNTTVMAQLRSELLFDRVELVVTGQNVFDFDYADDVPRPDRVTGGVPREGVLVFARVQVEL